MALNFKRLAIPAAALVIIVGCATGASAHVRPSPSPSPTETSIVVTPPTPVVTDVCGTDNDTLVGVDITGVSYEYDGYVVDAGPNKGLLELNVYASAEKGFKLQAGNGWKANEGGVLQFSHVFSNEPCLKDATTVAPTVTAVCGPDNDQVVLPSTEGIDYAATGWLDNSATVTATAKDGYALKGVSEWTLTDAATTCATSDTVATQPPASQVVAKKVAAKAAVKVATGIDESPVAPVVAFAASLLIMLGAGVWFLRRRAQKG